MRTATDTRLDRLMGEIEERQQFIDALVESSDGGDLSDEKLGLVEDAKNDILRCNRQMGPIEEARRVSGESADRIRQIAQYMRDEPASPAKVEYRSAGAYALDVWKAGLGADDASKRLDLFNRAAAHQTTADNPGLMPQQILGPVVNYIDVIRPLVGALGPRDLPNGSWSRPKVTQHTLVNAQSAEKAELPSQKMVIGKLPVNAITYGGYVNVSRQDIDWTQPQIMDIVISDLAAQYAIKTEDVAADALSAAATAGPTLPTGTPTPEAITGAFWTAAGLVYTATQGTGRLIAAAPPQMLGLIGPLFAPINPTDAQSSGFTAGAFAQGAAGAIAGIPVYVTAGLADNQILVLSTSAAEVYEDRVGALQVVEPSVLGVQVAYAGYFAPLVIQATGIQKIVKTP